MLKTTILALVVAVGFQAPPPLSAQTPPSQTQRIDIQGFAFVPARLEVHVGEIVEWTNRDLAPHTATADNGAWDTGSIKNEATGRFVVTTAGTLSYHCAFHPGMHGVIVVVAGAAVKSSRGDLPEPESRSMIPWDKLHGAMTHFPVALLLFSTACDFVSITFKKLPFARDLRLVSFYGLTVAALASVGAVLSGVALTKGDLWGRGNFAWHHRFVWPAFGLLVALAAWRLVARDAMSRTGLYLYLILMLLASAFVGAAGYFGGEILLSGGGVP